MINTPNAPQKYPALSLHPALQFLIFAGIFIGVLIVGSVAGVGLVTLLYGLKTFTSISQMDTTIPHFIPAMWIIQLLGTTLPILTAPLLFSRFVTKDTKEYIKPRINLTLILMVLVFFIMFFFLAVD